MFGCLSIFFSGKCSTIQCKSHIKVYTMYNMMIQFDLYWIMGYRSYNKTSTDWLSVNMTLKNHKVNFCLEFEWRGYWANIVENYVLTWIITSYHQSELADFIYKKKKPTHIGMCSSISDTDSANAWAYRSSRSIMWYSYFISISNSSTLFCKHCHIFLSLSFVTMCRYCVVINVFSRKNVPIKIFGFFSH